MGTRSGGGQGERPAPRGGGGDRGGSTPQRSPNDDRSDVKNDNNPAYQADRENREKQGAGG